MLHFKPERKSTFPSEKCQALSLKLVTLQEHHRSDALNFIKRISPARPDFKRTSLKTPDNACCTYKTWIPCFQDIKVCGPLQLTRGIGHALFFALFSFHGSHNCHSSNSPSLVEINIFFQHVW